MNRPHTSERQVKDLRRPDRRTAMKALVKKTYVFVDHLWAVYVQSNKADLRYIYYNFFYFSVLSIYSIADEVEDYEAVAEVPNDFEDVMDDGLLVPLDPLDDDTT